MFKSPREKKKKKKTKYLNGWKRRPTIKLHRHFRTNYRRLRYRGYLFRRGHIGLSPNFILETILRPRVTERDPYFRFQFHSLIKASVEKFERYGKRQVIYIAFSSSVEKLHKLEFPRRRNTTEHGFCRCYFKTKHKHMYVRFSSCLIYLKVSIVLFNYSFLYFQSFLIKLI